MSHCEHTGWNAGVAVLGLGQLAGIGVLAAAGGAAVLLSGVTTLALLGAALRR